jgi:RuvB-like protein 2
VLRIVSSFGVGSTGESVKEGEVGVDDLKRCYTYFLDEGRSVKWVDEQQNDLVSDAKSQREQDDSMQY